MTNAVIRSRSLVQATAAIGIWLGALAMPALAQKQAVPTAPAVSKPAGSTNPMREQFRDGMKQFQGELDQLAIDVDALTKKLATQSEATVAARKSEVEGLRQKLTNLGTQIQPDAPLLQRLDRLDQWLAAQRSRIENQRASLGVDFVERLAKSYREMQQEAGVAREQLAGGVKGIDSLLTELSRAEDRMAELLLAEDASAAVKELRDVVGSISKTIETIRTRVREQFGSTGA